MHPFVAAHHAHVARTRAHAHVRPAFAHAGSGMRIGADPTAEAPTMGMLLANRGDALNSEVKKTAAAIDGYLVSDQPPELLDAQASALEAQPFHVGDAQAAPLRAQAKRLRALTAKRSPAQRDAVTNFYRYWSPFLAQWRAYYAAAPWNLLDADGLPPGYATEDALVAKTGDDSSAFEKGLAGYRSRYAELVATLSLPPSAPPPAQPIGPVVNDTTDPPAREESSGGGMSTTTKIAIAVLVVGGIATARAMMRTP